MDHYTICTGNTDMLYHKTVQTLLPARPPQSAPNLRRYPSIHLRLRQSAPFFGHPSPYPFRRRLPLRPRRPLAPSLPIPTRWPIPFRPARLTSSLFLFADTSTSTIPRFHFLSTHNVPRSQYVDPPTCNGHHYKFSHLGSGSP